MGPYNHRSETNAEPAVVAIRGAGPGNYREAGRAQLEMACDRAGVQLGDHDRHIVAWLCGWEPETVQVIIGLIARAHAAGQTTVPAPGHQRLDRTDK